MCIYNVKELWLQSSLQKKDTLGMSLLSFVQGYPLLVYDSNFMCECTLDKCLRYCYSLVKLYCSYGFYIGMFRNVKLCAPLLLYNVHASYYLFSYSLVYQC